MSPLGKPTDDGEIVPGSRHYGGKTLGEVRIWKCPACGIQNDGRTPAQGCVHCGAGDPRKSKAAAAQPAVPQEPSRIEGRPAERGTRERPSMPFPVVPRVETPLRVLRLIEYLFTPGETSPDAVLRRSLVGRMDLPWGSITATIVDTLDTRQEDLLTLARRQPGVWLANPEAMDHADRRGLPQTTRDILNRFGRGSPMADTPDAPPPPALPDTGPPFSAQEQRIAGLIFNAGGSKLCYTLALALQTLAEELQANMEPGKFLTQEEALALANALMQEIPEDWQGDSVQEETDGSAAT